MGEIDTRWIFTAVMVMVAIQRLLELRLSKRNESRLRERGAVEAGAGHYPWMVALHTAFLFSGPLEVWVLERPFIPILAVVSLVLCISATLLRYWTIRTLGQRWTTRIICLPGADSVTGGPFRWIRHPNYLAVIVETVFLPLLHAAWITSVVFGVLNAILLGVRIRTEERALAAHTDYATAFGAPSREEGRAS